MAAGRYRHPVRIERPTTTRNSTGEQIQAWGTLYARAWVSFHSLNGREMVQNAQVIGLGSDELELRYLPEIDVTCRVVHLVTGKVYEIVHCHNVDERNVTLKLLCKSLGG